MSTAVEDWRELAACKGMDTDLFFVERGGADKAHKQFLTDLCWSCPVRRACLDYAMSDPYIAGWHGATTHRQRKRYGYDRWRERAANHPIE